MTAMTSFSAFLPGQLPLPAPPMIGAVDVVASQRVPRAKRLLDIFAVLLALPVLVPVFVAIAVAIKLSSKGPVFFRQTRVGQGGRGFGMVKFRSMVVDAEARRAEVMTLSTRDGLCFKAKSDPRITKVGRILRRTSLDEFPQLINVLNGDMSLVGPRPALPEEVAAYPAVALGRLAVLPGITGAWQVAGRANLGFDEMVALDLDYVRHATMTTDLRLLRQTLRAVASGRGAY